MPDTQRTSRAEALRTITREQADTLTYHYANLDYTPEGRTYREIQDYCAQHGHAWVLAPMVHADGLEKLCTRCMKQEAQ